MGPGICRRYAVWVWILRQYALALALFLLAGSVLRAGINLDSPLPDVIDSRSGRWFEAGELAPVKPTRVSAYCACAACCSNKWADGITASGTRAHASRTLAADPSVWPIGTCLVVPGVGKRVVEDTGSAIVGSRLDVYFDSHQKTLEWGVRWLSVREVPCERFSWRGV